MDKTQLTPSQEGQGSRSPMRAILGDALRYWEPRRIWYDGILAVVVIGWLVLTWPHFRTALTLESLAFLIFFAVAANLCYCAVYLAEIPLQFSPFQTVWVRWRFSLLLVGIALAVLFTNYWIADEIYPYVP